MDADHEWLTLSAAARVLEVSPATIRRWCDEGRLSVRRTLGGHRRVKRTDVEAAAVETPTEAAS